jgi:hypothetical protein
MIGGTVIGGTVIGGTVIGGTVIGGTVPFARRRPSADTRIGLVDDTPN